jgi:hypothetical protein
MSRTAGVRFAAREIDTYVVHSVLTGPGAHPASRPMGTEGSLLGVKRSGTDADQ